MKLKRETRTRANALKAAILAVICIGCIQRQYVELVSLSLTSCCCFLCLCPQTILILYKMNSEMKFQSISVSGGNCCDYRFIYNTDLPETIIIDHYKITIFHVFNIKQTNVRASRSVVIQPLP